MKFSKLPIGLFLLLSLAPRISSAGESIKTDSSTIKNQKCFDYAVNPIIVTTPISCGGGDAELLKKSMCMGVLNCSGTKVLEDGKNHLVKFRDSVVCPPVRGNTDKMEDAFCPSAVDCKNKNVETIKPKGVLQPIGEFSSGGSRESFGPIEAVVHK